MIFYPLSINRLSKKNQLLTNITILLLQQFLMGYNMLYLTIPIILLWI